MDWLKNNRWHLLAIGLVQGLIFSFLWRTFDFEGDLSMPVRIAADLLLAIPVLIYATENIPGLSTKSRIWIVAGITVVAVALQEYAFWVYDSTTWGSWFPQIIIPSLILMFISAHWLMHWKGLNPSNHAYTDLFHSTWRNAILCGLGVALTGVFWIVLTAGAALFKLIGINALHDLIEKSWFAIPATTTVFALVVSLGLLREEMIVSLRKLLLGLLKWFLPIVLALATVWSLALPFTGLETLFKTRSAAWTMMATVALSILFANAAFQDGRHGKEYPSILAKALQWMWIALIPVAGIAVWAMLLRIGQYEWTSDRLWGFFVALLAVGYAIGYSLSVLKRRGAEASDWLPSVAGTNRVMALVICLGIIALTSPILDAARFEANSQAKRVQKMDVTVAPPKDAADDKRFDGIRTPDVAYKQMPDLGFVSRTGRWGVQAGHRLTRNKDKMKPKTAAAVTALLPQQYENISRSAAKPKNRNDQQPATMVSVNPAVANKPLEAWIQRKLQSKEAGVHSCWGSDQCTVYWLDLNGDGQSEALLFGRNESNPTVLTWNGKEGVYVGMLSGKGEDQLNYTPLLPWLKNGEAKVVDSPWKRVKVGEMEYGIE